MRVLLVILIVWTMTRRGGVQSASLAGSYDPVALDNQEQLWKVLNTKLNTILNATDLLNQRISYLNHRLNQQEELVRKSFNHSRKWTTILRRQDNSVDFYRNWMEYRKGFGDPQGEFFIGLDKLHIMTSYGGPQELLVILGDWNNRTAYAQYDGFLVGSEQEKYNLKELGQYSGNAGDSLSYHKGMNFTTKDEDNDLASYNCAVAARGAWWFNQCRYSHLNGVLREKNMARFEGIVWYHWKGNYFDIKFAEMLIRPRL